MNPLYDHSEQGTETTRPRVVAQNDKYMECEYTMKSIQEQINSTGNDKLELIVSDFFTSLLASHALLLQLRE